MTARGMCKHDSAKYRQLSRNNSISLHIRRRYRYFRQRADSETVRAEVFRSTRDQIGTESVIC
jgi:hypothetical protein